MGCFRFARTPKRLNVKVIDRNFMISNLTTFSRFPKFNIVIFFLLNMKVLANAETYLFGPLQQNMINVASKIKDYSPLGDMHLEFEIFDIRKNFMGRLLAFLEAVNISSSAPEIREDIRKDTEKINIFFKKFFNERGWEPGQRDHYLMVWKLMMTMEKSRKYTNIKPMNLLVLCGLLHIVEKKTGLDISEMKNKIELSARTHSNNFGVVDTKKFEKDIIHFISYPNAKLNSKSKKAN